jgi:hypothetical protein
MHSRDTLQSLGFRPFDHTMTSQSALSPECLPRLRSIPANSGKLLVSAVEVQVTRRPRGASHRGEQIIRNSAARRTALAPFAWAGRAGDSLAETQLIIGLHVGARCDRIDRACLTRSVRRATASFKPRSV